MHVPPAPWRDPVFHACSGDEHVTPLFRSATPIDTTAHEFGYVVFRDGTLVTARVSDFLALSPGSAGGMSPTEYCVRVPKGTKLSMIRVLNRHNMSSVDHTIEVREIVHGHITAHFPSSKQVSGKVEA